MGDRLRILILHETSDDFREYADALSSRLRSEIDYSVLRLDLRWKPETLRNWDEIYVIFNGPDRSNIKLNVQDWSSTRVFWLKTRTYSQWKSQKKNRWNHQATFHTYIQDLLSR